MRQTRSGWNAEAKRLIAAVLVVLAGLWSTTALAGTELHVSAVILKVARVQVLSQPSQLQITEADIARGYVEVAAPMQVAIRSNTTQGYMLAFDTEADYVRSAHVRGLAQPVQLGPSGGVVHQSQFGKAHLALGFRFELAANARPGHYPWPVHLSAEPL